MTTVSDKVPVSYPGNESEFFGYSFGPMHPRREPPPPTSSSSSAPLYVNQPTARTQISPSASTSHLYQTSPVVSMNFQSRESEVQSMPLATPERVLESMQVQYPQFHQHPPQEQDFQYNPPFHTMGHETQDLDLFSHFEGAGVQGASTTSPLFGNHNGGSTGFAFAGPFVAGYSENVPVRTGHGATLHPFAPSQATAGRHRSPSSGPSSSPTLSYSSRSASSSAMSSPTSPNYDDPSSSSMIPSVTACASCKRSHIKCDSARPCQSCRKHPSKAKTCRDASPKPRGRPKGGSKAAAEAILMARLSQQQQQQLREQQQQHHHQQQLQMHHLQHFPQQQQQGPRVIRYTQNLPDRGPRLRVRSLPQAPKSLFVPRSVSSSALTSTLPPLAPPLATAPMHHPHHHHQQQHQPRKSSTMATTPPNGRCAGDSRCASPAIPLYWSGRPIRCERRPSLPIYRHPYAPTSPPSSVRPMVSLSTSHTFIPELNSGAWSNETTYPYIYPSTCSMASISSSLNAAVALSATVEAASAIALTCAQPMLRSSSTDTPHSSPPTPFLPTMTAAPTMSTSGPMVSSLQEWSPVPHPLQGMNGMGLIGSPSVVSMPWSNLRHPQQQIQRDSSTVFPLAMTTSPASIPVDHGPCDLHGLDMTLNIALDLEENQSANGSFLGTGASTSQLLNFNPTPSPPLRSPSSDNVVPTMEGDACDLVDIKLEGESPGMKMARLIQQQREVEAEIHLLHHQQQQQQQLLGQERFRKQ